MNDTLWRLIRTLADGHFHSGQSLAATMGIGQTAVSGALSELTALGGALQQASQGYRLERPLNLLDELAIRSHLGQDVGQRLATLEIVPVTESTNAALRAVPAPNAPAWRGMLAEYQTGGRGRQGKRWTAPFAGAILLSVAQRVSGGIDRAAGLSLVVGMAVRRALIELGAVNIMLKWPNDVFFANRKLAGVLIEVDSHVNDICQWVAGVGLNWRFDAPVDVDQPWTDLNQVCAQLPNRNLMAGRLLHHLVTAVDQLASDGLASFRKEWGAADLLLGRTVAVARAGGEPLTGTAMGIDAAGALLLQTGAGPQPVYAGTVQVLH